MSTVQPVLTLAGVSKRYGGVRALNSVHIEIAPGSIHALIGENGAGKSTLIRILCGITQPDTGEMRLGGESYTPTTPKQAKAAGVQVVHQEFNQLPYLSIAENICIEELPRNVFGVVDRRALIKSARDSLTEIGLGHLDVAMPLAKLGVAHRQLVEIARALRGTSRVLILDEPTATLTPPEIERLFVLLRRLRDKGVAILFVSHHLSEILDLCDRISVFRNGESVFETKASITTKDELVRNMVGRTLAAAMDRPPITHSSDKVALSLIGLRPPGVRESGRVSFDLHFGEIVGLAGLVGAGRTELARAIFGVDRAVEGELKVAGKTVRILSPADAISNGIGFVTEDRKHEGLILPMSIDQNVSMASLEKVSRLGLLRRNVERAIANTQAKALKLKFGQLKDPASSLSGGNQQKVVLAKWLERNPRILILDEPTRGIDVGAKAEIYALLHNLADKGLALLVVSSELPELMTLSDRILVMSNNEIAGEVQRKDFSEEGILRLAYKNHTTERVDDLH
jgi:ribose transport system ATP-binding protein